MHSFSKLFGLYLLIGVFLLVGLLPGCNLLGSDEDTFSVEQVYVVVDENGIIIVNGSDERIYTFVVGQEAAMAIRWVPRIGLNPVIAQGQREERFEDIIKEEGETSFSVYWWRATVHDGDVVPGEVQHIEVYL